MMMASSVRRLLTATLLGLLGAAAAEDPTTAAFNAWLHESVLVHKGEVKHTPNMGRGVWALEDVKEGAPLLKVPKKFAVCMDTVQASPHSNVFDRITKKTDKLAAFLLHHKGKGAESRFAPWFPVMPTSFDSPVFFTDEELEPLKGEDIYKSAQDSKREYVADFATLENIIKANRDVFPEGCCDFETYRLMRHMIESRAWHLLGDQYLVPQADFFNHAPHVSQTYEKEPDTRGEFFLAHHKVESDAVIVMADRDVAKGNQIFETYGDNSNFVFFMYHGFIPTVNLYECVDLMMPELKKPKLEKRIDMVQKLGHRSRRFCVREQEAAYAKVADFCRVKAMTSKDMKACRKKKGTWAEKLASGCMNKSNALSTFKSGISLVEEKLASYPSTLEQDLAAQKASSNANTRAAYQYVINRKRILGGLLEYLQAQATDQGKAEL